MPPDPTVALQAGAPMERALGGGGASGPLDTISKFAGIQNALNQNALFQQTFGARKLMGEIAATSGGDPDTMMQRILSSPAAPFAGEFVNSIRNMQKTQVDIANARQTGAQSGLEYLLKLGAAGMRNPAQWNTATNGILATTDPMYRDHIKAAADSIRTSLFAGLPADPVAAEKEFNARWAGQVLSAGLTPETLHQFIPEAGMVPGMSPSGLRTSQPILKYPAVAGGGAALAGPGVVEGLTPEQATSTQPGPMAQNLIPQQFTRQQFLTGQVPGVPSLMPGGVLAPPSAGPGGGAENPLVPPSSVPAGAGAGAGFQPAPSPGQAAVVGGAAKDYEDEGRKAYSAAVTGLGSIQYMRRAFDQLAETGWTSPGTGANARFGIARGINTLSEMMGTPADKLPFSQEKVATWEELHKESQRAGMQLVNQMFGAQRESQLIYQAAASAVPRIDNTPAGAKLILASLEQVMQRQVDLRNFETNWIRSHGGNITPGLAEQFNSKYSPEKYSWRAISQIQPYEVASPEEAKRFLPGTVVKVKGTDRLLRVTPQVSEVGEMPAPVGGQ